MYPKDNELYDKRRCTDEPGSPRIVKLFGAIRHSTRRTQMKRYSRAMTCSALIHLTIPGARILSRGHGRLAVVSSDGKPVCCCATVKVGFQFIGIFFIQPQLVPVRPCRISVHKTHRKVMLILLNSPWNQISADMQFLMMIMNEFNFMVYFPRFMIHLIYLIRIKLIIDDDLR